MLLMIKDLGYMHKVLISGTKSLEVAKALNDNDMAARIMLVVSEAHLLLGNFTEARNMLEETTAIRLGLGYKGRAGVFLSALIYAAEEKYGELEVDLIELFISKKSTPSMNWYNASSFRAGIIGIWNLQNHYLGLGRKDNEKHLLIQGMLKSSLKILEKAAKKYKICQSVLSLAYALKKMMLFDFSSGFKPIVDLFLEAQKTEIAIQVPLARFHCCLAKIIYSERTRYLAGKKKHSAKAVHAANDENDYEINTIQLDGADLVEMVEIMRSFKELEMNTYSGLKQFLVAIDHGKTLLVCWDDELNMLSSNSSTGLRNRNITANSTSSSRLKNHEIAIAPSFFMVGRVDNNMLRLSEDSSVSHSGGWRNRAPNKSPIKSPAD